MTQELTKDDLRGCPFCAGEGEIEEIESGGFGVGCPDCDFQLMTGPIGLGWHKSVSDAVGAWNERHADLCIEQLQNWTKNLQAQLEAANKKISELEQGKCLHQIAEPAEDIWPCINIDVDEHGAITNAKLYSPGLPAGNHDVYPVRVPYMDEHTEAWLTCVKELERFDSSFLNREGMNGIECAASVIRELVSRAQRAAAPQAVQAAAPLPLLLRDIARDLGITVPQACIALKPLGNYSTNSAVTAEMARMLRDHFPAPAHPADGVPAQCPNINEPRGCWRVACQLGGKCREPERAATQPAAQGLVERDEALEAVRKAFCKLQRYSFFLDSRGNVRRCADHCGNWVEFEAVHTLFEPQAVDAALAAQAKQGGA